LAFAVTQVGVAHEIAGILDDLAATPAILPEVVRAIREHERDTLREVTWREPGETRRPGP
jgi:hypothetical protein